MSTQFDLSNLTRAASLAVDAQSAYDTFIGDVHAWRAMGEYPTNGEVIAALSAADYGWSAGTIKVYACNLLKWAKSTAKMPEGFRRMVTSHPADHVKSKAGRKAGNGAGKTTTPKEDKATAEPATIPADWTAVYRTANTMHAMCAKLAAITSEDQSLMLDLTNKLTALAKRYLP